MTQTNMDTSPPATKNLTSAVPWPVDAAEDTDQCVPPQTCACRGTLADETMWNAIITAATPNAVPIDQGTAGCMSAAAVAAARHIGQVILSSR
jgi:hypothetical protein